MTETYSYRAEVGSNWKLFIDAFAEFYHAPVLHQGQYTKEEAAKIQKYGFEALYYEMASPHAMISTWGGQAPPADMDMVKPMDQVLRSGLFGPWDKPEVMEKLDRAAAGRQPEEGAAVGHRRVALLPEHDAADLGARLVPDLPLLADRRRQAHLRVHAVFRSAARTRGSGWPRSWPRSRSRSTRCRTPTPWRRRRR